MCASYPGPAFIAYSVLDMEGEGLGDLITCDDVM